MIQKYDVFIKESLRDKMVGISDEEVEKKLSKLDIPSKLKLIKKNKLDDKYLPSDESVKEYFNNQLDKAVVEFKKKYEFLNDLTFVYTQYYNEYEDYAESNLLTKEQAIELGHSYKEDDKQYIEVAIVKPYATKFNFLFAEKHNHSKTTQFIDKVFI